MILYQILLALALPVLMLHAALTGGRRALRERLGLGPLPAPGPRLWLHGASNGELASGLAVIKALIKARPGLQILVTCNSLTGRDLVVRWGLPGVSGALAPFDTAGAAGRLLDRFQPQVLVVLESEFWPARLAAAHRRGVQVLVIGARLSARSAARWALWPGLFGALVSRIDWLSPQDAGSGERLAALGLPVQVLGPQIMLKAQTSPALLPAPFAAPAPRTQILLAASTHDGEEAGIVAAFAEARHRGGPQFMILAPRHAARGPEIARLIAAADLPMAQRSRGQMPGADTQVYLADTMGEMPLWYAMAGICLIGGTFAERGGHTPFEPASHGCALIHGPSVSNFAPQFAALALAQGAVCVAQVSGLAEALLQIPAERQASLAAAATACLATFSVGIEPIIVRIQAALPSPAQSPI